MTIIAGHPFLTDFQTTKLLKSLSQKTNLKITHLKSQQVYIFSKDLAEHDYKKAIDLLNHGDEIALNQASQNESQHDNKEALQIIVSPRFGTISPWASKATDIFNNCEIAIDRVERLVVYTLIGENLPEKLPHDIEMMLYDRMTQSLFYDLAKAQHLFHDHEPAPLNHIDVIGKGREALESANREFGFALSSQDIDYLMDAYVNALKRNPTDVELMMFAQANSEHCRHKIFNAQWTIDGEVQPKSLFGMIKNTFEQNPNDILSAYKDNAAVVKGHEGQRFYPLLNSDNNHLAYDFHQEPIDILMKVETHNHPTAIAPYAGAATGSGGEIRDEGATGRGGKPKAGLAGFHVSHLQLPDMPEKWEHSGKVSTADYGKPARMASALEIMTQAPLGSAAFSNEFGRPNLVGYFRSFQLDTSKDQDGSQMRGYHKPIMIAGGYGNIKRNLVEKNPIQQGDLLIVLGGPAMQIGLGGGAASSVDSGELDEGLDFASVQRDNAEMERRCQEVIDRCWAMAGNQPDEDNNPIVSIHDVGAGGLSNAMPELVNDHELGAVLNLRKVPSLEHGMSPMAIWSNEAQERYVLAIRPQSRELFDSICERERCPYAILGEATDVRELVVNDPLLNTKGDQQPVDMPLQVLLGGTPKMQRSFSRSTPDLTALNLDKVDLAEAVKDVLRHPTVASKSFLISIGDRSITGMVIRDQYVGRYQVPVADCAVTASALIPVNGKPMTGEAMSMGERTPVALINPAASARLAVAEAITNIAGANIAKLSDITLSANWMAACGEDKEDQALFDAVYAVGEALCPALGIAIPVGKDSLSMRANWSDEQVNKSVVSPMSLIITAFAPVQDVTKTLTPELLTSSALGETAFYRLDLSKGQFRLGGSILAQTLSQLGDTCPDLDNPQDLINFFDFIQQANNQGLITAYHDIGDGGLLATIAEMQFTSRQGVKLVLSDDNLLGQLFAEELGALIQVKSDKVAQLLELAETTGVSELLSLVGQSTDEDSLLIQTATQNLRFERSELEQEWSKVGYHIAKNRDNPECVQQAFDLIGDKSHQGLIAQANYDLNQAIEAPYINSRTVQPKVAILREQGVNGQLEMAAGFKRAGLEAVDVHMSDLLKGRVNLRDFDGLVACGGFSYGDVLGAGAGWAKSVLFHDELRMQFVRFFTRPETFSLGVCNGCQMMSQLKDLIPGAENFPLFIANKSARFEARTVNVKIERTKSVLLKGMQESILPIAVAHGEGFATLSDTDIAGMSAHGQIVMRYVDSHGTATEHYPLNPNGSPQGVTGICSTDGRVTLMMPHPERNLMAYNHSWKPEAWDNDGAWMRMFRNARAFLR
ncbi:phosphoribosylformylglycinamidine synthase [Leucothrix sargassi]|nr:phosphoribosylformylglycinamidine synthase [Leucothrix sargassi]